MDNDIKFNCEHGELKSVNLKVPHMDTGARLNNKDIKLVIPYDGYVVEYSLEDVCIGHNLNDKKICLTSTYNIKYKNGKTK